MFINSVCFIHFKFRNFGVNTILELLFGRHSHILYMVEKGSGIVALSKLLCLNVDVVSIIIYQIGIYGYFLHVIDCCIVAVEQLWYNHVPKPFHSMAIQ